MARMLALRSSSIIVSREGLIKVADFGVGRVIADSPAAVAERSVEEAWYLSPEQTDNAALLAGISVRALPHHALLPTNFLPGSQTVAFNGSLSLTSASSISSGGSSLRKRDG